MRVLVVCVALVGHFNVDGRSRVPSIHCVESLEQPPPSVTVPFVASKVVVVVEDVAKFATSVITC